MEWVLASEKKPENGKVVMLCGIDSLMFAGYYNETEDLFFDVAGESWRVLCWADVNLPTFHELDIERL